MLLSAEGDGSEGIIDLAARLGLESTGISLPIARTAKALTAPATEPLLVLIGTSHPVVEQLIKDGKWQAPSLQPGEGLIQLVRKAFGEKSALVVTGGDATGVRRAVYQLAETFPHIWQRGKDRTTLDDVEEDVRKFVAGRSPAGQAAMSLYKLDKLAAQLKGKDLASARVKVFVEKADAGPRRSVEARCRRGDQGVVAERRRPEHRRAEGPHADQRRLRHPVGGRRVLDQAARQGHSRTEEETGGQSSKRD